VGARERIAARELSSSNERLRLIAEERSRLSRDLHDGAIQSVFGLGLGLDYCLRQVEKDPPKAIEELCRAKDELNEVIAELRKMVLALQSNESWRASPQEAWQHMLTRLGEVSPIPLRISICPNAAENLSRDANIHLLNIAREAVTNAIRHSKASGISVDLRDDCRVVELVVCDNGIGFDRNAKKAGQGLANIAARVAELSGLFECSTARDEGTRIIVKIYRPNS
jgi:signal transduction histidine kinase